MARNNPLVQDLDPSKPMPLDVFCQLQWALRASDGALRGPIDDALEKQGRSRKVVLAMPHFAPLVACISGSHIAAAVPAQFATTFAEPAGLRLFDLPFPSPAPEIRLYWHSRRTRDPANAWLRRQVSDLCQVYRMDG